MAVLVDYRGKPAYDIYVKGSPEVPELGDCKLFLETAFIDSAILSVALIHHAN